MKLIYYISAGILLLSACKKEFSSADPSTDLLRKVVAVNASGDSVVGYFYYDSLRNVTEYRRLSYEAGDVRIYQLLLNWDGTRKFLNDYEEIFYNETNPEEKLIRKFILDYDQANQQYTSKYSDPAVTSSGFQQDSIRFTYDGTGRLRSKLQFIRYENDPLYRRVFFSQYSYNGGYNITEQADTTYNPIIDADGNQTGDSAYLSSKTEFTYDNNFNPIRFTRKVAYALDFNIYAAASNVLKKTETFNPDNLQRSSREFDYRYTYNNKRPLTCDLTVSDNSGTRLIRYTYYYESDQPSIPE